MSSVFNRVMTFLGVREEVEELQEDNELDYSESVPPTTRKERTRKGSREAGGRRTNLVSLTGGMQPTAKMVILEPDKFSDVRHYVEQLKNKRSIIIRLDKVERDEAQRIIDFMCGATHAMDGNMRKLGEQIFCFAPPSVEIEGDADTEFDFGGYS